jgi:osmotically-inducible protein OsmY
MHFRRTTLIAALAASLALPAAVHAQAANDKSVTAGEFLDDTIISNSIRARVIGDKDLTIRDIGVETHKGVVQLSGFVDNDLAKIKAENIARDVKGVKEVHNNLIVK